MDTLKRILGTSDTFDVAQLGKPNLEIDGIVSHGWDHFLRTYGFLVLRTSIRDAQLFQRCSGAYASNVFGCASQDQGADASIHFRLKKRLQHVDSKGVLRGWNRPSAAKEVYRLIPPLHAGADSVPKVTFRQKKVHKFTVKYFPHRVCETLKAQPVIFSEMDTMCT
eukprot:4982722-Amphidinium_carterae.1